MPPLFLPFVPAVFSRGVQGQDDALENESPSEMSGESAAEIMKEMDKDNDGFLSLAELFPQDEEVEVDDKETDMFTRAFDAADVDKDGKLSADELPAMIREFEKIGEADEVMEESDAPNEEM